MTHNRRRLRIARQCPFSLTACRRGLAGRAAAVAMAVALALAPPAAAETVTLERGSVAGLPWRLTAAASSIRAGNAQLPALCVDFRFAWGPGQAYGNGAPDCVAPARGTTAAGPPWRFDTTITPYNGLGKPGITRVNRSVRAVVFFANPRARRVVAMLADGERLRVPAHRLPGSLHRPASIALSLSGHAPASAAAAKVLRAVAYDARGRIVGRMSPQAPALPVYTYS